VRLNEGQREKAIREAFVKLGRKWKMSFFWKELKRKLVRGESHSQGSESYLITAMGRDRTGIVYSISRFLAQNRLNITDLNSRILGQGSKAIYAMMLEVDIPKRFNLKKLESNLTKLKKKLGVEIQIKPVERVEL